MRLFSHELVASYFNVFPTDVHLEIRELEVKVGEERNSLSDSIFFKGLGGWVPYPGHTRGIKKQFLNLVALHWQMKILLGLVLRYKQVEKYNLFASLEDIKRMLRNTRVYVNGIGAHLRHVEIHVTCELEADDHSESPSSKLVPCLLSPHLTRTNVEGLQLVSVG